MFDVFDNWPDLVTFGVLVLAFVAAIIILWRPRGG